MATSEDKKVKVHSQTTTSKCDHLTTRNTPQLMSLGTGPSVVFPPNKSSLSTSKPFSQSVIYSRSSSRENFSTSIGGARPKMLPKTPEASNFSTTFPDASQNSTSYGTKSDKESVDDYDRDKQIGIKICYEVHGIKTGKTTFEVFDFDISNVMKWKYVTSSASWIFECNEYLRRKFEQKSPTNLHKTRTDLPVSSGNVCLNNDSVLIVGFLVNNKGHVRQIANDLLIWIFDRRDLMVATVDIKKNETEAVMTQIKSTSSTKVLVEAIETKVHIVYQTRSGDQIERILNRIREERLREERIPVKKILSRFTENIKHRLFAKYPELSVQFVEGDGSLDCILKGPKESVSSGIDMLRQFEKELIEIRVYFTTEVNKALHDLRVENQVNDLLSREHPECVAEQKRNEIRVYGLDDTVVRKACFFVSHMIIECEPKLLLGDLREKKNDLLRHFHMKFAGKLVASVDRSMRLHLIGFREAVNGAMEEFVEINEGRSSITSSSLSKEPEQNEIRRYLVHKKKHFLFMEKYVLLKNMEKRFDVKMIFHRKLYEIEVKGASRNVEQAYKYIASIENDIRFEGTTIINQQAVSYFQGELCKEYVDSVGLQFGVLIEKEVIFDFNKVKITKQYFEENIIWSDTHGRKLILERNTFDEVLASIKAVSVLFDPKGRRFIRKDNVVTIGVPCWIDGNHGEEVCVASSVVTLLTKAAEGKDKSVAFAVAPIEKWPFDEYARCLVKSSVHWLLDRPNAFPLSVLLFTDSDDYFQKTDTHMEECVKNYMKERRPKGPKISLLKAQLDQTEADVLVNTTAPNLDLSYGGVSAAISYAAGPGLQQECRDHFSKGITEDDIAVTDGYRLKCKHVFHITLSRYRGNMQAGIESIRKIMKLCLKAASDYGHATIAFPAIGTGNLLYPEDIVVSEMFGAVERHRIECPDTKLKEVCFVIFPKDTELFKKFKRLEDKLRCYEAEQSQTTELRCGVTFKLTGMERNVLEAKAELESKGKALSISVSKEITERISDVTSREYQVITELYSNKLTILQEKGVKITYSSRKKEVIVTGSENLVADAMLTLNEYVRYVNNMQTWEIAITTAEKQNLNKILRESSTNRDVCCVYDSAASCIVVFARGIEMLEKTSRNLQSKLQSMRMNIRQEDAVDRSDYGQFSANKGAASYLHKTTLKRTFSWSKDAKQIDIYENGNLVIKVYEANILHVPVEGIVTAVNQDLHPLGTIAYDIARKAGDEFIRSCENIVRDNNGRLRESAVVRTTAGNLDFKFVIPAVFPVWSEYKPFTTEKLLQFSENLEQTITNCLMVAESSKLRSIVLSGIHGLPSDVCAVQYARSILEFSNKNETLCEIHVVDKDRSMIDIVHKTFATMITERKASPYPLSVYVDRSAEQVNFTDERSTNTNADERKKMKLTGRDRPKPRPSHNEDQIEFMKEKILYKSVDSFGSSNEIHVHIGDILQLEGISAVVCSETTWGDSKGQISKTLFQNGGLEYKRNKDTQFKSQRKIGEIITTEGGKNKYTWIIHAIISRTDVKVLSGIYRQIFQEVRTRELPSLALPLLGAVDFGPVDSAKAMFDEWFQFSQKNMKLGLKLYLVINDASVAEVVQEVWKRCMDEMKPESSSRVPEQQTNKQLIDVKQNDPRPVTAVEDCVICMDKVTDAKILKCGHTFCKECIDGYFRVKKVCPTCGKVCGIIVGDQPDGTMTIIKRNEHVTGFESFRSIAISYRFGNGTQGPGHPKPGAFYKGIARTAYLPDNKEGREICAMLKIAFERRLVFTIGASRTTGQEGVITWNDIHHKTDMRPNTQFGYPDQTYLQRVREELEVKGVTMDDVDKKFLKKLEQSVLRHTVE